MLLGEDLLAKADAGGRTRPARSQLSSRRLSIGPAMSATMAIKLIERNAHVCFKLITRTTITWKASESESKKQYGNQLFHFLLPSSRHKHPRLLQLSILPSQRIHLSSDWLPGSIPDTHSFGVAILPSMGYLGQPKF
jgi:hypothetical protein